MGNTTIPAELVAINAIQGTLIADNAITAVHIGQNQVHSVQLAINSVTATQIADGTITSAKIQDGTIATADIADVQITTAKLADNSVTSAKIVNASIVSADIANNAILTQHIDDNQITADQIADNAVGLGQLASLSRGSIIYGDSAGNPAYLAAGTNGHVLTSDGTDISWTADTDLFLASSGGTVSGDIIISASTDTPLIITTTNSNGPHMRFQVDGNNKHFIGSGTGIGGMGDADDLALRAYDNIFLGTGNSSTKRVTIDSSGGVGIGTDNPQAALHVAGGFNATAPTGNGVMMGYYLNSYGYIQLNGTSGGYIDFSTSGTDHKGRILYDNTHNYLRLDSNGSERLRIDSSGNVGIGTETPSEKLEVNGKIRLGGMRLANNDSGRIGLNRNPDDGSTTISGLQRFQINGPFSGGDYLDFQNYNSSGNYIGGFRVDGGAIRAEPLGISTPSYSFDNDTDTGMTRPTGNTLQLVTGGTERIRIDANGLVGIGNDDAGSMHAKANKLVVGSGSAGGMAIYNGLGEGWYAFARAVGNNTDAYDGGMSYTDRVLRFHTNAGQTRFLIDASGDAQIYGHLGFEDNKLLMFGGGQDARLYFDASTNALMITASNGTANTVNITANNFQIGGATPLISGTANDSVVINQDGASNVDFRVESDNEQYNFFCDASSEIIHFGEGTNSDTQQVLPAGTLAGRRHGYHGGNRTHAGQTFKYSEGTSWTDAIKIDWNNASWGGVCMRITGMYNYSASNNFSIVIGLAGYSAYGSVSYDATSNGVLNWTTAIQLAQTATGETMIRQRAADSTGDVVYRYEWQIYNRSNQTILIVEQ